MQYSIRSAAVVLGQINDDDDDDDDGDGDDDDMLYVL